MTFDAWWFQTRNEVGSIYATIGQFSIRAVAKLAWEAAKLQNTCGTCQHWHKDVGDKWRWCEKIIDTLDADKARIYCDIGETNDLVGLETTAEFGCVLWEGKEESDGACLGG